MRNFHRVFTQLLPNIFQFRNIIFLLLNFFEDCDSIVKQETLAKLLLGQRWRRTVERNESVHPWMWMAQLCHRKQCPLNSASWRHLSLVKFDAFRTIKRQGRGNRTRSGRREAGRDGRAILLSPQVSAFDWLDDGSRMRTRVHDVAGGLILPSSDSPSNRSHRLRRRWRAIDARNLNTCARILISNIPMLRERI